MFVEIVQQWAPLTLWVVLAATLTHRARTRPVGLAWWLLPAAFAMLTGMVFALVDWSGFEFVNVAAENRARLYAAGIATGLERIQTAVLALGLSGLFVPWLITWGRPRPTSREVAVALVVSSVAVAVGFATGLGWVVASAALLTASATLCWTRVRGASADLRVTAFVVPFVHLLTWLAMPWVAYESFGWRATERITPENRLRTLRMQEDILAVLDAAPWVAALAVISFCVLAAWLLRQGTASERDQRWGLVTVHIVAPLLLGAVTHARFDELRDRTNHEVALNANPYIDIADLDLPKTTSQLPDEDGMTAQLGREAFTIRSQRRGESVCSASMDGLEVCLQKTVAVRKADDELLGRPFNPLLSVAADRCVRWENVHALMVAAVAQDVRNVKLVGVNGRRSRVINAAVSTVPVPDEILHLRIGNDRVSSTNFAVDVPGVRSEESPCDGLVPDVEELHRILRAGYQDKTIVQLTVEPDTPVQTVFAVLDAIRWKPSAEEREVLARESPNTRWDELYYDPVFLLGDAAP